MARASTAGNWQLLKKDLLSCPVCKDFFDDTDKKARSLTCLHSICSECLEHYIRGRTDGTFECPLCKYKNIINEDGLEAFQVDFHKQTLIDYLPDESRNKLDANWQSQNVCEACESHPIAVSWCNECKYLCKTCSEPHYKGMFLFKNHQVTELNKEVERDLEERFQEKMCKKHKHEIKQVCVTCLEPVCDFCIGKTSHGDNHEICPLSSAAAASKQVLDDSITSVLSQQEPLRQVRYNIATEHTMIQKQADAGMESLNKTFEKCHQAARTRQESLAEQIKQPCSQVQKQLVERKESAELKLMQMGSSYEHASEVLDKGSDIRVVRTRKEVEPTMNEISSWKIDTKPVQQLRNLRVEYQEGELEEICEKISSLGTVVDEVVTIENTSLAFVGTTCSVNIQVCDSSEKSIQEFSNFLQYYILDPSQREVECNVSWIANKEFKIEYVPKVVGKHTYVMFSEHDPSKKCQVEIDVYYISIDFVHTEANEHTVMVEIMDVEDGEVCGFRTKTGSDLLMFGIQVRIPQSCDTLCKSVPFATSETEHGEYTITFKPVSCDAHFLIVHVDVAGQRRQFTTPVSGVTVTSTDLALVNHRYIVHDISGSLQYSQMDLKPYVKDPKGKVCSFVRSNSKWCFHPPATGTYDLCINDTTGSVVWSKQMPVYKLHFYEASGCVVNRKCEVTVTLVDANNSLPCLATQNISLNSLEIQVRNKCSRVIESHTEVDGLVWKLTFVPRMASKYKIYTRTDSSSSFVESYQVQVKTAK